MSSVTNPISILPGNIPQKNNSGSENYGIENGSFFNLLEEQMQLQNKTFDSINAGGFDIQDLVTSVNDTKKILSGTNINDGDMNTTAEMVAYLTKPFNIRTISESNFDLMNFAKKHAANFYNKCASNVVTDLTEFVEDTLKL